MLAVLAVLVAGAVAAGGGDGWDIVDALDSLLLRGCRQRDVRGMIGRRLSSWQSIDVNKGRPVEVFVWETESEGVSGLVGRSLGAGAVCWFKAL